MKTKSLLLGGALMTMFSLGSVFGEPTRTEQIMKSYGEDRARGLISLNQRYITAYEKELDALLRTKKLEEANEIQGYIKELKAENESLKASGNSQTTAQANASNEVLLVGKTIGFPHNSDPSKPAFFSFQKDGKALWLGMKNQAIPRSYRPTGKPGQFLLWWRPANQKLGDYLITLNADGKTVEMLEVRSGKSTLGVIKKTE